MLEDFTTFVASVAQGASSLFHSAAASNRVSRMAYYLHELLVNKEHPCLAEMRANMTSLQWQFANGRIASEDYQTYAKSVLGGIVYSMLRLDTQGDDSVLGKRYAVASVDDLIIDPIDSSAAPNKASYREKLIFGLKIHDIGARVLNGKLPFVRGDVLDKYFPGCGNIVSKSAMIACEQNFERLVGAATHASSVRATPPAGLWERLNTWKGSAEYVAADVKSNAATLVEHFKHRLKDAADPYPREMRQVFGLMYWQFDKERIEAQDADTFSKVLIGSIVQSIMLLDNQETSTDSEALYDKAGAEADVITSLEAELGLAANATSMNGKRHRERLLFGLKAYDIGEQVLNKSIPFVRSEVLTQYFPNIKQALSSGPLTAQLDTLCQEADELAEYNAKSFLGRWFS